MSAVEVLLLTCRIQKNLLPASAIEYLKDTVSSRVATFTAFPLLLSSLTHIWVLSVGSLKLLALFQESITTPGLSEVADKFVGAPGAARGATWVEASCLILDALCEDITYMLSSYSLAFILTVQLGLNVAFSILNSFLSNLNIG